MLVLVGSVPAEPAGARQFSDDAPFTDFDVSDEFWLETATIWVIEEIAAIGVLGVFEQHDMVDRIMFEVPLPPDDPFETMIDYDADNVALLNRLRSDGRVLSGVVEGVMGPLPRDVVVDAREGRIGTVDPMPWLVATTDLLLREGRSAPRDPAKAADEVYAIGHFFDLLNEGELPTPEAIIKRLQADSGAVEPLVVAPQDVTPSTVAPIATDGTIAADEATVVNDAAAGNGPATDPAPTTAPDTAQAESVQADTGPAATDDGAESAASAESAQATPTTVAPVAPTPEPPAEEAPSDSSSLLFVVAGVGGLLALAVVAWLLRRRGGDRAGVGASPTDAGWLLESSRRMTAALDVGAVADIAVDEAVRALDASGGVLWSPIDDEALAGDASLGRALVDARHMERVVETIQSTTEVVDLSGETVSVVATPIASGGRVVGVLVVQRPAERPFGRAAVDTLQPFAPLVGSALAAARVHSSAVTEADIDGLTGLKNRRRLDRDLAALPRGSVVGFAMVDVDHFKHFNDTNGHQAGDLALQMVGECLAENVRSTDVVYRYGGEEFSVVLVDTTEDEARDVLERVRGAVEAADIPGAEHQPSGRVTISVGLVVTGPSDPSADHLASTADEALYRAKHDGRNRVILA